jgi:acyl-CoA thioesterase II
MTGPDTDPETESELDAAVGSAQALRGVLELLDPTPVPDDGTGTGGDRFVGGSHPTPWGRVYGGQVLAQALVAATRTVDPDRPVHSLHAYFLRAGDPDVPLEFSVERLRDGRSFSARRTHAIQHGRPILSMIASFQTPDEGVAHQVEMPDVPGPDEVPSLFDRYGHLQSPGVREMLRNRPIDMRHIDGPVFLAPADQRQPHQALWLRSQGPLPDDDQLHATMLAYASDFSVLESILRRHGLAWSTPGLRSASLDHAMWFHRPGRVDEWLLYVQESPSASGARGLGLGRLFTADGVLIASVAQEGMVRIPAPPR